MMFLRGVRHLTWAVPFAFLGLTTLTMLRPVPTFPVSTSGRVVEDGQREKVAIPQPFRTIAGTDYLETTHAPETLFKVGGPEDRVTFGSGIMGRLYPRLLKDDNLWTLPADLETILAQDDGSITYFAHSSPVELRRLGLPVLNLFSPTQSSMYSATRVENAAIGHPERGEAILRNYERAYADVVRELQPGKLTDRPRVLPMGCSMRDWSNIWVFGHETTHVDDDRAGVTNASMGFEDTGRQQETERILAMDPDIIFLGGESVDDFLIDRRWRGLKAVKAKRVYSGPGNLRGGFAISWGVDFGPLIFRWAAELAHPDLLQPKVRALFRSHFVEAYGYRLSDGELDNMLRIEENKQTAGYRRFLKTRLSPCDRQVMSASPFNPIC